MSRSRKKTPASTIACCKSQKKDKQMCNRLFRSKSKQYIRVGKEPPCRLREVMNVWNFAGDGKVYWGYDWQGVEKLMRKKLNIFALSYRGEDLLRKDNIWFTE